MIFIYFHVTLTVAEILRSRFEVVPSQMSKIVIYVCTLIKCVSVIVKSVSVVVNLSLSQMSLMLPEFTHFIFIIIDMLYHSEHKIYHKTYISSKSTSIP